MWNENYKKMCIIFKEIWISNFLAAKNSYTETVTSIWTKIFKFQRASIFVIEKIYVVTVNLKKLL